MTKLTQDQVKMLKALARLSKRYGATIQADGDVLYCGGLRLMKVTPLGSFVLKTDGGAGRVIQ